jgi:Flp pilus assembly protein TadD
LVIMINRAQHMVLSRSSVGIEGWFHPIERNSTRRLLSLLGDGRLGKAHARLSRLSRKHPGKPEIGLHLAGALHAAGGHTEALPVFLTALDRFPDLSVAAVGLSRVW